MRNLPIDTVSSESTVSADGTPIPSLETPPPDESQTPPRRKPGRPRIHPKKEPTRLPYRVKRRKSPVRITPAVEISVAAMAAAGVPRHRVAKALNISPTTALDVMHRPSTQELISEMRETIRRVALEGVKGLSRNAWDWANDVAREKADPRAFDALSRSLLSMEKLSSSASGESRKVEGVFTHEAVAPTEELRALLKALREEPE